MQTSMLDLLWTAPLAGISDSPFRMMNRRFGAKFLYSEMASVEGLSRKHKNTFRLLETIEGDSPLIVQLFGSKPESFAKAVVAIEHMEHISEININSGCPVKKVVRSGSGSALMKNPALLGSIVRETRKSTTKKVSVKLRSGWDSNSINVEECARICEQEGADSVAVHPRTAVQMFAGHSDWSVIRSVKQSVGIPVIGNGDVVSIDDARKMMNQTGCDGVMVGRALVGNPWFFSGSGKVVNGQFIQTVLDHISLARDFYGDKIGYKLMKKHLIYYAKHLESAPHVNRKPYYDSISKSRSIEEEVEIVRSFFGSMIDV